MGLLDGKVALITGASRGIGKAIALKYAAEGADIAFTDLVVNQDTVAEIAALGHKVKAYESNAANFEQTQQIVEQILADFGKIDILVNNAGITKDGLVMRMTEEQWDAVIAVNMKSAFNFMHAVVPAMARAKSGSIINMASIAGQMGNPGQVNYAATKAGLIAMAKSVAKEMGSRGIRANAIAPGFIISEMTNALPEAKRKEIDGMINTYEAYLAHPAGNVSAPTHRRRRYQALPFRLPQHLLHVQNGLPVERGHQRPRARADRQPLAIQAAVDGDYLAGDIG